MQPDLNLRLPEPDAVSAAHSARVAAHIRARIAAAGGCIGFAEYMQQALYAPGLGYYSAGSTKFGAAGDFVTAPEVSPVFARVLARQCRQVLDAIEDPAVLEIGAGSGRLAVDLLRALAKADALPAGYHILEVSADLRERQEALLRAELPDLVGRVRWLEQLPGRHHGVIIANEVLDALPVERFVRRADGPQALCVAVDGDRFVLEERPALEPLATAVASIEATLGEPLPAGYVSEVCLTARPWLAGVAAALERGVVFLFDYGVSRREYYAADRSGGWLRCHFRHHAHDDALILPGIQDIAAWVDFSAVADAAHEHGLDIAGYVTQAQFLIAGGLDQELAGIAEMPLETQLELAGQVKLLTLPGEMGENFKCLGLRRGGVPVPRAFLAADRTATL